MKSATHPMFSDQLAIRSLVILMILTSSVLFTIIPISQALRGSFYDWNPLRSRFLFVGFANYIEALRSKLFWSAMLNNVVFTTIVVAFRVSLGLGLAIAIYSIPKFKELFRTVYFIPIVCPLSAIALVWLWMYHPRIGLFNVILDALGFTRINWLQNPKTALGSIMVMTIWKDVGYAIVIYLAGLLNLPKNTYEAADIDGANRYQTFWYVTLPLLRPTTLFVMVTSLISYLQSFTQIFIMTRGGPGTKTYLTTYLIYNDAFRNYRFGYASAVAFLLFLVIAALTYVQFKVTGKDWEM
jgi:multiple sugar transport system permease protein